MACAGEAQALAFPHCPPQRTQGPGHSGLDVHWPSVARALAAQGCHRSADQCKRRYRQLKPDLVDQARWDAGEDEDLLAKLQEGDYAEEYKV